MTCRLTCYFITPALSLPLSKWRTNRVMLSSVSLVASHDTRSKHGKYSRPPHGFTASLAFFREDDYTVLCSGDRKTDHVSCTRDWGSKRPARPHMGGIRHKMSWHEDYNFETGYLACALQRLDSFPNIYTPESLYEFLICISKTKLRNSMGTKKAERKKQTKSMSVLRR